MSLLANVDWNGFLRSEMLPLTLLIVCVAAVIITAIIAPQARKSAETRLKEKMIERGYTASEIGSVISAGSRRRGSRSDTRQQEFLRGSPC